MPIRWNPEIDAKLFLLILQECAIAPTGAQLKKVATTLSGLIGSDVSPKAVTEHLAKIKKTNPVGTSGSAPSTPRKSGAAATGARKSAVKKTTTPKAKANGIGMSTGKYGMMPDEDPTDDEETFLVKKEKSATPRRSVPPRGPKRNYAAMEDNNSASVSSEYDVEGRNGKKIKPEPKEEDEDDDDDGASYGGPSQYQTAYATDDDDDDNTVV